MNSDARIKANAMRRAAEIAAGWNTGTQAAKDRRQEAMRVESLADSEKNRPLPNGWKLVPIEPTLEMIGAAADQADCMGDWWRAMLAAAPPPPSNAAFSGHEHEDSK